MGSIRRGRRHRIGLVVDIRCRRVSGIFAGFGKVGVDVRRRRRHVLSPSNCSRMKMPRGGRISVGPALAPE
jgi:hypothetical protein